MAWVGSIFSFGGGRKAQQAEGAAYAQEIRTEVALLHEKMAQAERHITALQDAEKDRVEKRVERASLDATGEARLTAVEGEVSDVRRGLQSLEAKIDTLPARVVEAIRAQPQAA